MEKNRFLKRAKSTNPERRTWYSFISASLDTYTKDELIAYIAEHNKYLAENKAAVPYSQANVDTEIRRIKAAQARLSAIVSGTIDSETASTSTATPTTTPITTSTATDSAPTTTSTANSGGESTEGMSTKMKWVIGGSIGAVLVVGVIIFALRK